MRKCVVNHNTALRNQQQQNLLTVSTGGAGTSVASGGGDAQSPSDSATANAAASLLSMPLTGTAVGANQNILSWLQTQFNMSGSGRAAGGDGQNSSLNLDQLAELTKRLNKYSNSIDLDNGNGPPSKRVKQELDVEDSNSDNDDIDDDDDEDAAEDLSSDATKLNISTTSSSSAKKARRT